MKYFVCIIALIAVSGGMADTATQTDWSGGDSVPGPVFDWYDLFFESDAINWSTQGELGLDPVLVFSDSFNRYCPDDWGTPDVGGTYYYVNPGSAFYSITDDTGYMDDNGGASGDGNANSEFSDSTNVYIFSFLWKYQAGHYSGIYLGNDSGLVIGVYQHQTNDKLYFRVNSVTTEIRDREPNIWNDYRVVVNGTTAELFINDTLQISTTCDLVYVDRIKFNVNGAGDPSDQWFDNVQVYTYPNYASLTSSILYLDNGGYADWEYLLWDCIEPSGTGVALQVRASDDYADMGPWSTLINVSGADLSEYLDSNVDYFQYKVVLTTSEIQSTPVFNEVSIDWLLSIEEGDIGVFELLPIVPNPTSSSFSVQYTIPEFSHVEISLYDLSGRQISSIVNEDTSIGEHNSFVYGLPAGVYICRMRAGGFEANEMVVVIQ